MWVFLNHTGQQRVFIISTKQAAEIGARDDSNLAALLAVSTNL